VRQGEAAAVSDRKRRRAVFRVGLALPAALVVALAFAVTRPPPPQPRQEIVKVPPKPARVPRVQSAPIAEPDGAVRPALAQPS
jgi:hypothetical protein